MPTSIPYDPSLYLGDIVKQDKLKNIEEISALQSEINSSYGRLNSNIQLKKNLEMTMHNLVDMRIDPSEIKDSIKEVETNILEAAKDYAKVNLQNSKQIMQKSNISLVSDNLESPIDYTKTQIKTMPLSADSLKMDAQYFSYDENKQGAENSMAAIKSFISDATSFLGDKNSLEVSNAVQSQINAQREHHEIDGTLIITASCTHKNAILLSPFILDVDKGIRVWNELYPKEQIKVDDLSNIMKIAMQDATTAASDRLHILSGATYGSSFVGMVHVLRSTSTKTSQNMLSVASSMQGKMSAGCWFADVNGGFGADESFSSDVKKMLSSQDISSHISLVTMGSIPTIKSNEVKVAVKEFAKFDPAEMLGKLATLQNATVHEKDTVNANAEAARTGGKMMAIRGTDIKNVMLGLGSIDDGKNKMLDINSLMTAFEDYAEKALQGNIGVPINYYLRTITKAQLAKMWVTKYYPGEFLAISGDDSESATTATKPKVSSTNKNQRPVVNQKESTSA